MELNPNPLDTGRKLNVHKTPEEAQDVFITAFIRSIYILYPGGTSYSNHKFNSFMTEAHIS